ncbi:MAG: MBL fold metallo-hydrolase [Chitinophagales bacterium]
MSIRYLLLCLLLIAACNPPSIENHSHSIPNTETSKVMPFKTPTTPSMPYIAVLGIAQDAGYPQAACQKACCKRTWHQPESKRLVSCLALIDPISQQRWLFDATPDFREQLQRLDSLQLGGKEEYLSGIFLTHAHIGHYTGLMHLGREVMGTKKMKTYAMPRMQDFLTNHAPWSQLVKLENIAFQSLQHEQAVVLNERLKVTPFLVPHRDEFSETVGFKIEGTSKSALFIPDIDKWHLWDRDVLKEIEAVDYAFLDATFYANGEIAGRDMSEIPHPFVEESMKLFADLPAKEKAKVHFIHFNHTNPVLNESSEAHENVLKQGFRVAKEMSVLEL